MAGTPGSAGFATLCSCTTFSFAASAVRAAVTNLNVAGFATTIFIDRAVTVVIDLVFANFFGRKDLADAIVKFAIFAIRLTSGASPLSQSGGRTGVTALGRDPVVDLAVAVVVRVVTNLGGGKNLTFTGSPFVSDAGLCSPLAAPFARKRWKARKARTLFARRTGTAIVNDPIAVVVLIVAGVIFGRSDLTVADAPTSVLADLKPRLAESDRLGAERAGVTGAFLPFDRTGVTTGIGEGDVFRVLFVATIQGCVTNPVIRAVIIGRANKVTSINVGVENTTLEKKDVAYTEDESNLEDPAFPHNPESPENKKYNLSKDKTPETHKSVTTKMAFVRHDARAAWGRKKKPRSREV